MGLPTPYYESDKSVLYCADCLDMLPNMKGVGAVVTDPPYGVGFAHWDGKIPPWLELARSISGTVLFTTAPTTAWDYPRPDWMACWYRPASSSRSVSGGFNHWSPVLVYGKHKFPVDTINLHAIANAYPPGFEHPSPKPLALVQWMLSATDGDTVLDPFMGSGTTGVACMKLGRKFIGIEIEPKYCEVAKQRIVEAEQSFALFEQPKREPEPTLQFVDA